MNDTAIGLLTYETSDPALEAAAGPYNDDPLHEDFGPKNAKRCFCPQRHANAV